MRAACQRCCDVLPFFLLLVLFIGSCVVAGFSYYQHWIESRYRYVIFVIAPVFCRLVLEAGASTSPSLNTSNSSIQNLVIERALATVPKIPISVAVIAIESQAYWALDSSDVKESFILCAIIAAGLIFTAVEDATYAALRSFPSQSHLSQPVVQPSVCDHEIDAIDDQKQPGTASSLNRGPFPLPNHDSSHTPVDIASKQIDLNETKGHPPSSSFPNTTSTTASSEEEKKEEKQEEKKEEAPDQALSLTITGIDRTAPILHEPSLPDTLTPSVKNDAQQAEAAPPPSKPDTAATINASDMNSDITLDTTFLWLCFILAFLSRFAAVFFFMNNMTRPYQYEFVELLLLWYALLTHLIRMLPYLRLSTTTALIGSQPSLDIPAVGVAAGADSATHIHNQTKSQTGVKAEVGDAPTDVVLGCRQVWLEYAQLVSFFHRVQFIHSEADIKVKEEDAKHSSPLSSMDTSEPLNELRRLINPTATTTEPAGEIMLPKPRPEPQTELQQRINAQLDALDKITYALQEQVNWLLDAHEALGDVLKKAEPLMPMAADLSAAARQTNHAAVSEASAPALSTPSPAAPSNASLNANDRNPAPPRVRYELGLSPQPLFLAFRHTLDGLSTPAGGNQPRPPRRAGSKANHPN